MGQDSVSPTQVGLATAGIAAVVSRGPMLLPRRAVDQVLVTGLSAGAGFVAGSLAERSIGAIDAVAPGDRQQARLLTAAAGGTLAAAVSLRGKGTSRVLGPVASGSAVLAASAAVGAGIEGSHGLARRLDPSLPGDQSTARSIVLGTAATAAGVGLAARYGGLRTELQAAEPLPRRTPSLPWKLSGNRSTTPLPSVSGGPDSLLPRDGLTGVGERFVDGAMPATTINKVMGESGAVDPIRVYAGLAHGDDAATRAAKAADELDRLGAFEPGRVDSIVLYSPSGTGFVNPVAVEANEFMARGRTASVAIQYGNKPSFMSLHKVDDSAEAHRQLLAAVRTRLDAMPAGERPSLRVYGESLGAHGSQDVMLGLGPDGLRSRYGVDRALWSGSPGFSKTRHQVLGRDAADYRAAERVTEIPGSGGLTARETKGAADLASLPDADRQAIRIGYLSHPEDSVVRASLSHFYRRPPFLGKTRPAELPDKARYVPVVTGVQAAVDVKNGATVIPGVFDRVGHDYRADLPGVIRTVFGFETSVTPSQLDDLTTALVQNEIDYSILYRGMKKPPGS